MAELVDGGGLETTVPEGHEFNSLRLGRRFKERGTDEIRGRGRNPPDLCAYFVAGNPAASAVSPAAGPGPQCGCPQPDALTPGIWPG